jgi:hypothetical protein
VAPNLIDSALAERVSPSSVGRPTPRVAGSHEVSLAGSSLTTTTTRKPLVCGEVGARGGDLHGGGDRQSDEEG